MLYLFLGKGPLIKKRSLCFSNNASHAFQTEVKSLPMRIPPTSLLCASVISDCCYVFEQHVFNVFYFCFLPTELSSPMQLESDMKKQEHLWQNQSPNFLAEKAFNAAVAALQPHCAICSLFCPYAKVQPQTTAHAHISELEMVVIEVVVTKSVVLYVLVQQC